MYPAEEVVGSLEGTQLIQGESRRQQQSERQEKGHTVGHWREEGREDKSSFCNSKFHKKPGLKTTEMVLFKIKLNWVEKITTN